MKRAGIAVLAGALLVVATAGASAPGTEIDTSFRSAALGRTLGYEVYLPAGYATSGERYPVVYFLHGLPSTAAAYRAAGFAERALDRTGRQAILVAPQGASGDEPDPEYLARWDTAIATELVRTIDARYRTIASRSGRAIVGYSAGGYGAMHLGLSHLDEFGVVESWSGYFHPTDPTGTKTLQLGSADADARADVHRQSRATKGKIVATRTLLAFYVGRADRFAPENEQLNQELSRAGIPHVFRLYDGGHTQALWSKYAEAWLSLALSHLASPTRQ